MTFSFGAIFVPLILVFASGDGIHIPDQTSLYEVINLVDQIFVGKAAHYF